MSQCLLLTIISDCTHYRRYLLAPWQGSTLNPVRSSDHAETCILVVSDGNEPSLRSLKGLEPYGEVTVSPPAHLGEHIQNADILLVWSPTEARLHRHFRQATPVRWTHTATAGVDALLFPELVESSVVVTNSRGVFEEAMAEYVIGVLFAFSTDLPATFELQRQHRWQHRETRRLAGRHLVVVGSGSVGRAVVRVARAVGMTVEVVGHRRRDGDPELGQVLGAADLFRALSRADDMVVAAPLTTETRGLIGGEALHRLRRG